MSKSRVSLSHDIVLAVISELQEQGNLTQVLTKGELAHLQDVVERILAKN